MSESIKPSFCATLSKCVVWASCGAAILLSSTSALAAPAQPTGFAFTEKNSALRFTGSYDDEPVPGRFKRFSGSVMLVAGKAGAAIVPVFSAKIDVSSLDTEYAERDEVLQSAEWFNTAQHRFASFQSKTCQLKKPLTCTGTLEIRGVRKDVQIAIELAPDGKSMTGSTTIARKDFKVGSGEWEDAGVIGPIVKIQFVVRAGK